MNRAPICPILLVAALSIGCARKPEPPAATKATVSQVSETVDPADEVFAKQLIGVWKGTVPSPSGHADKDSYEEYRADGTVTEALISPDMPPVKFSGTYRLKGGKLLVRLTGPSAAFGGGENAAAFQVTGQQLRIGSNVWYRQPAGTKIPDAPEAFSHPTNQQPQSGNYTVTAVPPQNAPSSPPPTSDPGMQNPPPPDPTNAPPIASQPQPDPNSGNPPQPPINNPGDPNSPPPPPGP